MRSENYEVKHFVLYSHVKYFHNNSIIKTIRLVYDPAFLILHVLE